MKKCVFGRAVTATLAAALFVGCAGDQPTAPEAAETTQVQASAKIVKPSSRSSRMTLNRLNARFARKGEEYRVGKLEYITAPGSGKIGITVFANDVGNRRAGFHFAPDLVAKPGSITYAIDQGQGAATGGLSSGQTTGAINRAMATWGSQKCFGPELQRVSAGGDLGLVSAFLGFGGGGVAADINHAGWLPGGFFDAFEPGGGDFILGVTFTFFWVDGQGNLVDTNRDRLPDAAFSEIYYNQNFPWSMAPNAPFPFVDAQSIALHEAGHGFGQGHFGKVFVDGSGKHGHFAPQAVMNAIYIFPQRSLRGSDRAGHCNLWAGWN